MNMIIAKLLTGKNGKPAAAGQILPTSVTPSFLKQFFNAWLKNTQSQSGKLSGGINNQVGKIKFKSPAKDSQSNNIKHFSVDGVKPKNPTPEIVKALSISNVKSKKLAVITKQHTKILTSVKTDREPENVSLNCRVRKTKLQISLQKMVPPGSKEKKLRVKAETGGHEGIGQAVELTRKVPISKGIKPKTTIQIGTTAILNPKNSKILKPTGKAKSLSNSIEIETKKPALATQTDKAQVALTNSVGSNRKKTGSKNSPLVPRINKQDVRLGKKVNHPANRSVVKQQIPSDRLVSIRVKQVDTQPVQVGDKVSRQPLSEQFGDNNRVDTIIAKTPKGIEIHPSQAGDKVKRQTGLKQPKAVRQGNNIAVRAPEEVKAFPNNSSPADSKQSQQVEPPINQTARQNSAVREQSPNMRTGIKVNPTDHQRSTLPDTPLNHSVNLKSTVTSATAAARSEAHLEPEVNKVDNPRVDSKPVPPAQPERPGTESNYIGKQIKPSVIDNNPRAVKANIEAIEIKRTITEMSVPESGKTGAGRTEQAAYGANPAAPANQSLPAEIAIENRPVKLSDNRSRGQIQYTVANESVAGSDANQTVQMRSVPNPVPVSIPRIVQQITQTIIDSSSGITTQTNFRVDGGNLGTMQIQFQNEAGQNQATIVVESENARLIVQKLLSDITESLAQKGIVLTSLDVRIGQEQRKNGNSAGRPNRGNRRKIKNDDESLTSDDSSINKTDLRDYGYNTIEVLA